MSQHAFPFPRYPIGPFLNQPGADIPFAITRFEQMADPNVEDPHTHAFYEILWVEQGQSVQSIDGKRYALGPGSLFFISPGQLHAFEVWDHLEGGTLMFTEQFYLHGKQDARLLVQLSYLDNPSQAPLFVPEASDWQQLMLQLRSLEAEKDPVLQRAYLEVVLLLIDRALPKTPYSKQALQIFKQFRAALEATYLQQSTAGFYANLLGVSLPHLSRCCRAVSGQPASWHIEQRRIVEAQRLLAHTALTVSEIAYSLSFHDTSHFAKAFRNRLGLAPLAYRQQYLAGAR